MIGIYKITNTINNKCYIGQSIDVERRMNKHKIDLLNNKHGNEHMQNSFNKYGIDNFKFELLIECKAEELDEFEIKYIKEYNSTNRNLGYNISSGGSNGNNFVGKSEEEMIKFSNKVSNSLKKLYENSNERLRVSMQTKAAMNNPEVKAKISGDNNSMRRKGGHSKDSKDKISKAVSGCNNGFYGKNHSEETKKRISASHKGKKLSEETKLAISKGVRSKLPKYMYYSIEYDFWFKGGKTNMEDFNNIVSSNEYTLPTFRTIMVKTSIQFDEDFKIFEVKSKNNTHKIMKCKYNYYLKENDKNE